MKTAVNHSAQTIVERLGGHPQYILQDAPPELSERENRKAAIAEYLMLLNFSVNAPQPPILGDFERFGSPPELGDLGGKRTVNSDKYS
jgi:hypothetical protein